MDPAVCRLLLRDGSAIRSQVISVDHWQDRISFDDLNPSTYYRFFCGSGSNANEMSRHFDMTTRMFWMPPVPVSHTRRNLIITGCSIILGVVGYFVYPKVRSFSKWRT